MSDNYLSFFDPDLKLNACRWAFYFDCLHIGTFDESYRKDCEEAIWLILNSLEQKNYGAAIKYTEACSVVMVMDAIINSKTSETELFVTAQSASGNLTRCQLRKFKVLRDFYLAISTRGSSE